MHQQLCDVSQKYGPLVRIAPRILLTSDPEVVRKSNAVRTPYKRSNFYSAFCFDPTSDNIISQQDDELHRVLRGNMAPGYSGKENENIELTIDSNVSALINLISNKYISSASEYKPVDFAQKVSLYTLDAIADLTFGKPFGNLVTDTDVHGYISAIEKQGPFVVFTTNFPWLMDLLKSRICRPLLPSPKDTDGFGRIMAVAHSVSTSRFLPDAEPQRDMLGSFVRNGMTLKECKSETILQIIAGSDTTATAIRMTFFHIISNPSILARLLEEIKDASLAPDRIIRDNEAKKLPYL